MQPKALIIRAPGTNCDNELATAFAMAGARPEIVHLDKIIADGATVERFDILALPGGFSYGDDIASGRIVAARLKEHLYTQLAASAARGSVMFAVCNGFQIAVQAGLLPGPESAQAQWPASPLPQETSLTFNASARFIDRWVPVRAEKESVCVWTQGLAETFADTPDAMMLPIAHGEGRFVVKDVSVLARLKARGQVPLRYAENPNGSTDDIVGICDVTGRIFGLMPHPERYLNWQRHPFWTRLDGGLRAKQTPGMMMFRNAVQAASLARA